jgi:hypothetical protein
VLDYRALEARTCPKFRVDEPAALEGGSLDETVEILQKLR